MDTYDERPQYMWTDDRVAPSFACPKCGEARMDQLANDDGIVTCQSCGAVYDLEPERPGRPEAANA